MTKDERQFEQLLAAHCAPVLKNRKTANMFHIERDRFHDLAALLRTYQQKLSQKGIDFALFQAECPRVTVFVYQQRRLSLLLQRSDIQAFLSDYGYPSGALSAILQHLDHRLSLCESYPHEIGISSVRGGTIVGEHEIIFAGHDEIMEIRHTALSREIFAQGAIAAAKFLIQKKEPGLYNMGDLIASI